MSLPVLSLRSCWTFIAVVSLALTGACAMQAQTAPTLLPYTSKLIAGGGSVSNKATVGGLCPSSGLTAVDVYGDGCLATEIALTGPRYAIADSAGNVFFSDYTNGLIRRVDAATGVVNLVAGSVYTSPTQGQSCGTGSTMSSTDVKGDGCLGVQVNVYRPIGLVFSPSGDLYFSEYGNADVRKIAATGGLIPQQTVNGAVVYTGVISLIAGNVNSTFGYTSNFGTTTINAATASYLDAPYGLAFDASGDLFLAEEYKNAVLVVDTSSTGSNTVTGVTIPAGTISKIVGATSTGSSTCPNTPATTNGCNYGTYTSGSPANSSETDSPYAVALDTSGNVYFANTYTRTVAAVSTTGTLTNFAGVLNTKGTTLMRAAAGSFGVGTVYSVAVGGGNAVYLTDPVNGVVWRADGTSNHPMYVVAGGASTVCSGNTDSYGDGCPATQATLGSTPSASTPVAATGVFGVTVDSHEDLFLGDTATNLVREIASGTQFGQVGSAATQTLQVHFAQGDSAAGATYVITSGSANFTVGTPTCATQNSDMTTDCTVPVTAVAATSANLGAFTGTLQVTSGAGQSATFQLSGTHVQSPVTRLSVGVAASASCTGATSYATGSTFTLTATVIATSTAPGSVQFYSTANGVTTAIGSPVAVNNNVASTTATFPTAGTYTISATYTATGGYFMNSSGTAGTQVVTAAPGFSLALVSQPGTGTSTVGQITQGQTAIYGFTLSQTVYSGTLSLAVTGLPANTSVSFSPSSVTGAGCSTSSTVVLSVQTTAPNVKQAALGGSGTWWQRGGLLAAVLLMLVAGLQRKRLRHPLVRLGLVTFLFLASTGLLACGIGSQPSVAATPTGSFPVTVTVTGASGSPSTASFTMVVNPYTSPYK